MPFFSKVFKSKDASKKQGKTNGLEDIVALKPSWTDAWTRKEIGPDEIAELIRGCTVELKARGLDMPFLLLPFRPASDPSASRTFIRNYFGASANSSNPPRGEALAQELRLTEPMVLCSVLKWCWSRLPGGVVTWEAYELFKVGEQDSNMARDAFSTFIPISSDSDARTRIIFDFFDFIAAIAAHGKSNGLGGRKLSRYAGWWAFEHTDLGLGFDAGYKGWASAADATSHLFFAYLRSLSPDSNTHGISALPMSLQALVNATEYPPQTPTLMQHTTKKVVMIVDTVSPTPFALLRRTKHFEYRDEDYALQQFANYEDPVQALTDECQRVLKAISSANQSSISTSKTSTSLRTASWSRFEDIGFGASLQDSDDENSGGPVTSPKPKDNPWANPPTGLRSSPYSVRNDLGRPTTPSWADFLSTGFQEDGGRAGPLLLPPDKVLPPIETARGQSSQSHRRPDENLDPAELASISVIDVDDAFWWVWISSLASEEPTTRKAVFGRCALIETNIRGGKWLVMEEQVKGAAPEPDAGAYIAEKKRFFGFTSKKSKLSRSKSTMKKPEVNSYKPTLAPSGMSKTSIAPDQHARIQAAAAALQKKNQDQGYGSPPTNGTRRARAGDEMSTKTNSVMTLQPVIMKEASPAMKWATQYDKAAVRAAYLGSSLTGKGASTEMLTLPTNGLPRSESALSVRSADKNLPPSPSVQERSIPPSPAPVEAPVAVAPPEPAPMAPEPAAEAAKVVSEAAEVPLPAPVEERVISPEPAAASEARPPTPDEVVPAPLPSPTAAKKLHKEKKIPRNTSGLKGIFGKKKNVEAPKQEPPKKAPIVPASGAVAAARAAYEQKAANTTTPAASNNGPQVVSAAERFSGMKRKEVPTSPTANNTATAAIAEETSEATSSPVTIKDDGAPVTRRDAEYDALSRVDSNERLAADQEFSTFDQGPMHDMPAFVPEDGHDGDVSTRDSLSYEPSRVSSIRNAASRDSEREEGEGEQPLAVQDRWAQIRKNAAERAARASEEQSRPSAADRTDDGETTGGEEETIESRVARIKARVAELTGNMEAARQ